MGQPAEDVRIAAQLIERADLGMLVAEIDQEAADGATVLTGRVRTERGCGQGFDGSLEQLAPTDVAAEDGARFHD